MAQLSALVESLRVQLAGGVITRADAIEQLTSRHRLTEAGAADLLDGGITPAPANAREPVVPRMLLGGGSTYR